jgi:hypothetical protein
MHRFALGSIDRIDRRLLRNPHAAPWLVSLIDRRLLTESQAMCELANAILVQLRKDSIDHCFVVRPRSARGSGNQE